MRYAFIIIMLAIFRMLPAQNYSTIPVKEEYDLFNTLRVNSASYNPCTVPPNDDAGAFGDGMSKVLEGYITMYKATGDKAYLYKFVHQSLCMVENRHDYQYSNTNNVLKTTYEE